MKTTSNYKSIGGVESVALYPVDAVATALFSSEGCEVELLGSPIEVALMDDASHYEECSKWECGATTVSHQLHLVAEMSEGATWCNEQFLERAFFEGFVAVVTLASGVRLLVGYSALFANEQPLRLDSITSSSGSTPHETPSVTLRLVSHDTEFSAHIL
jgi:hypothetical protein